MRGGFVDQNPEPRRPAIHLFSEYFLREPELLACLRQETRELPLGGMQISPEQGQFMALLMQLMGARRCLEVGTFTGYSALACALALPPEGELLTLDISDEWTRIAQRYWLAAGWPRGCI